MATLTSTSPSEENIPTTNGASSIESTTSENTTGFNLDLLSKHFNDCLDPATGTLDMNAYIRGYEEIYKFLNLLGTVFGWVATDVHAKLEVLRGHCAGANKDKYVSIQSMVDFEVSSNLIKPKAKDSSTGSRNLLRLHRALDFVSGFLEVLPSLSNKENCCPSAQAAYKKGLAKHHPWVVQKAATMGMNLLPTKEGLIAKFCANEEEVEKASRTLGEATKAMNEVYAKTQEIYAEKNILDLP